MRCSSPSHWPSEQTLKETEKTIGAAPDNRGQWEWPKVRDREADNLRPFRLSHKLFTKAKKEAQRVIMSVFNVHGTEAWSNFH